MRNKYRIKPFLSELENIWEANPDLRFGQLISILAGKIDRDIFFPEEDEWLEAIRAVKTPYYQHNEPNE